MLEMLKKIVEQNLLSKIKNFEDGISDKWYSVTIYLVKFVW